MMLRASVEAEGGSVDLKAIVDRDIESLVPHGALLANFAEAVVGREERLPQVRDAIVDALGPGGLIDAAGSVANFQRMVRIADGIGIPLDERSVEPSADLRAELGVERYRSAANTFGPD